MNSKLKQMSLVAIATSVALYGCSDDNYETPEADKQRQADVGLWAPVGEIVQVVDSDFYPLTSEESEALATAKASAKEAAAKAGGDTFDPDAWEADFKYESLDLYSILGLTNEELARKAEAKKVARTFKDDQGMKALFDKLIADGKTTQTYDEWIDVWFETVAPANYLGSSTRLSKALRGEELGITSADNGKEISWLPPLSCPNYQESDSTGELDCVTPIENPLADSQPDPVYTAAEGEAVIYYRSPSHNGTSDAPYADITIHSWNDDENDDPTGDSLDCTSYTKDSQTTWGSGKSHAGIDENYGMYWVLNLLEGHDDCGNIIVYNTSSEAKMVSTTDLRMALGETSGPVKFANADKTSYMQEGVLPASIGGNLYVNQHPLLGAASGAKGCGWGTELNAGGDACIGETLACPTGSVAVGQGTTDVASKCVEIFNPDQEGLELFVRGAYHTADWSADDANKMKYFGNGKFLLNYEYGEHTDETAEGDVSHNFKVADSDWSEPTNFGIDAGDDGATVNGVAIDVTVGEGVAENVSASFTENTIYQFELDASKPEEPTLSVRTLPLNEYTVVNVGELQVPLTHKGDNKYTATRVQLEAGTFNLTIEDPSVGADQVAEVDGEGITLIPNGGALTYTVEAKGEYDFVLDLADRDAPVFAIRSNIPFGKTPTFIRGGLNGWNAPAEDQLVYNESNRTYTAFYGLEAGGTYAFKFADDKWGDGTYNPAINLGYGEVTISDDEDAITVNNDGGNMRVNIEESTVHAFQISFAESSVGEVKVTPAAIYIRGGIYGTGDWGADETMRLHFEPADGDNANEAGHVFESVVTTTGPGSFKIADFDWGEGAFAINYGLPASAVTDEAKAAGENQVVLGQPIQLILNQDPSLPEAQREDSQNIGFNQEAGTYRFSFNWVTKQLTVTAE